MGSIIFHEDERGKGGWGDEKEWKDWKEGRVEGGWSSFNIPSSPPLPFPFYTSLDLVNPLPSFTTFFSTSSSSSPLLPTLLALFNAI